MRRNAFELSSLAMALLGMLVGCNATAPVARDGKQHAECLVCKHNADLACIDVAVDKDTPRCTKDGKTYYFCSGSCCNKFQKNPAKYGAP